MYKEVNISGWGQFPRTRTNLVTWHGIDQLKKHLSMNEFVIVKGNGRSYGDIGISPYTTIDMTPNNRLIHFDQENLIVEFGAGVLLSEVIRFLETKGCKLFVVPGTKYITLGGAIACDVHGKNQPTHCSFGNHLISFELLLSNGDIITCSSKTNVDYYRATIGGIGLTGIILSAKIRVRKLVSNLVSVSTYKLNSLNDLVRKFEESKSEFNTAWLPSSNKIVYSEADYVGSKIKTFQSKSVSVRHNYAGIFTAKKMLQLVDWYLYMQAKTGVTKQLEEQYLQPLDRIWYWNRLYVKGFVQVQFLVNKAKIVEAISIVSEFVSKFKLTSFLGTLKKFSNGPSFGMMSFVKQGYVYSIDIKYKIGLEQKLVVLADEISALGGRFYLAKDAFVQEKHLMHGYKDYPRFKQFVNDHVGDRFRSCFSERTGIHLKHTKSEY